VPIPKPNQDNLKAAVDKMAETLTPTVSPISQEDDGPADKQVLIRTTEPERERWKQAASKEGISLSQFIRDTLNARAKELIDCLHPIEFRRWYPWAEFCLKCDSRLR
jgi:predicted DNA binding CopG/RHH family protein